MKINSLPAWGHSRTVPSLVLVCILLLFGCDRIDPERTLKVQTGTYSNASYTTCQVEGTILDVGENGVKQYGICYSSFEEPTINDLKTEEGASDTIGQFTSLLTDLTPGTRYYYKAYASDEENAVYGSQMMLISKASSVPTVETKYAINLTKTTATLGGVVTDEGGAEVTWRGICYDVEPDPEHGDPLVNSGTGSGAFSADVFGLSPNTVYYARAFAVNENGVRYGDNVILKTYKGTVEGNSGEYYYTVDIGDQTWMASSLRSTHFANGDPLDHVTSSIAWEEQTDAAYCYYDNDAANADTFGALYNFYAAIDERNICPPGWHVPDDSTFRVMELYLGMPQNEAESHGSRGTVEGGMIKAADTTYWDAPNTAATNETSFNAMPGGARWPEGNFTEMGQIATFWIAEVNHDNPVNQGTLRHVGYDFGGISRWWFEKTSGFSVRCIKDDAGKKK